MNKTKLEKIILFLFYLYLYYLTIKIKSTINKFKIERSKKSEQEKKKKKEIMIKRSFEMFQLFLGLRNFLDNQSFLMIVHGLGQINLDDKIGSKL